MSNLMSYEEFLKSDKAVKDSSSYGKRKNKEYYQQYVAEHSAELNKNQQLDTLEKDKSTALRENDIVTERAKRYLNAVALKNGIQGTGYAQAKASELYAQEASRRTEINNAYNKQKNDALSLYEQTVASAKATAAQNLGIIEEEEKLYNEQQAENDRIEVLQQMESNRALYESGELDYEGFAKYYNENKDKLDSSKDSTIIGVYDNIIADEAKIQAGTISRSAIPEYSFSGLGNGRKNDNIEIHIGGRPYLVETGESADESITGKLNELATGDKNTAPTIKSQEGWAKSTEGSNSDTEQRLVVYNGKLYIYTKKGWKKIRDKNIFDGLFEGSTQEIIDAFLNSNN